MKIYILIGYGNEEGEIQGAYSTKEKALEACPYFNYDESDIREVEIDPPNVGEKYEEFYYFNIFKDKEEVSKYMSQPSRVKPISYGYLDCDYQCAFQGTGRSIDEARINAYKARDSADPVWQVHSNVERKVHHADRSGIFKWELGTSGGCYAVHKDLNVCMMALEEYKKTGRASEFITLIPAL